MAKKVLLLPGDGIGPEIIAEAEKLLETLRDGFGLDLCLAHGLIGGAAIDETGEPLPEQTLSSAQEADAVLLGAVGGTRWDPLPAERRPERGLLKIRAGLGLFANLRPVTVYQELADSSPLKAGVVAGLDILIVRELIGDVYFGEPRGVFHRDGERVGINTLSYTESQVRRIAKLAFELAMKRSRRVCSVDKANVLEASALWREVVSETAAAYPELALTHMYVDNAAMQLVRAPKQFDVLLTSNMFGDILSDLASMLTGSIGMLPSASLDGSGGGLYEPIHGSAPDIAGKGVANPLATILSVAMMLRYSLGEPKLAARVEAAVQKVLRLGLRTADLATPGTRCVDTAQMGDGVMAALR